MVAYAPAIEGKLNPRSVNEGGAPALHFTISTAMMNQRLESWLMADDHQHSSFNMGLATIELKRGTAPAAPPGDSSSAPTPAVTEVEIEETIFAFAKAPTEHIAKVMKGGSTGASAVDPAGGWK